MEIKPYAPSMLPALAELYNQTVAGLPHCYPVSPEVFAKIVLNERDDEQRASLMRSQQILVARDDRCLLGFADAAVGRLEEPNSPEQGIIRFFCYGIEHRPVGQALLQGAEEYLRDLGISEVVAFHQDFAYPFYHLPHAYLSDRVAHVHALFGINGYRPSAGEVFLDWPDYLVVEPGLPGVDAEIVLEWKEGEGQRPNLVVLANRPDEEWLGVCENRSAGRPWRPREAEDWFHTHWLGVSRPYRRKGLARYLLRRTFSEMRARGYRNAAISTAWDNFAALLLYCSFGYRVVDWTYALTRALD